ncbi:hypothetical protein Tco_0364425 [Tanacetum coccineum]
MITTPYSQEKEKEKKSRSTRLKTQHSMLDMAPLLTRSLRHPWLRYQVERLTDEMRGTLAERIRMIYTGDEAQELFTSHAWRRLFKIRGPLLGGARRMTTWRQFILALGFHTAKEMAEDRFEACWACPSYTYIRDLVRRLCHMLISYSISGGQYLSRHAERRKSGARLFGGHFIGRLDAHFDLVSDERLIDLTDIAWASTDETSVAIGAYRQSHDSKTKEKEYSEQ